MKRLNLIVGLSLGCFASGCPSDDTGDEGAGTTEASATDTGTTASPTSSGPDETTVGPDDTTDGPDMTSTGPGDTTEGPGSTTDEPGTTGEPALSFEADVYPIIAANCSCHVNGAPAMLSMADATTAYGNLVGIASANPVNDQNRIEAGDPDASFVWHKLNNSLVMGEGDPMPLGADPLGAADLATIEQWILDGALP